MENVSDCTVKRRGWTRALCQFRAGERTLGARSPVGTVGSYRHCDVQCVVSSGEHAGRAREIVETGGCVSSRYHHRLAALRIIFALLLKLTRRVIAVCWAAALLCTDVHPCPSPALGGVPLAPGSLGLHRRSGDRARQLRIGRLLQLRRAGLARRRGLRA